MVTSHLHCLRYTAEKQIVTLTILVLSPELYHSSAVEYRPRGSMPKTDRCLVFTIISTVMHIFWKKEKKNK